MAKDTRWVHAVLATIVVVAALPLYVVNLGWPLLWADEATTALLSRHVLESGLPLTGEGNDIASQDFDRMRGWRGLETQVGWAQDYLGAAGLWLAGTDGRADTLEQAIAVTRAGRWPFVLCALLAIALTGMLVRDALPGDPDPSSDAARGARAPAERTVIALWAMALTASSELYILHARQLRYFAPTALFTVMTVHGYVRAVRGLRGGYLQLAAGGALLAISNDLVAAAVFASLGVMHLLMRWPVDRRLLAAAAPPAGALGLWILLTLTADRYGRLGAVPGELLATFVHLSIEANAHLLPWLAVVAVVALRGRGAARWAIDRLQRDSRPATDRGWDGGFSLVVLAALVLAALLGVHAFVRFSYVRYLLPAAPLVGAALATIALRGAPWRGARSAVAAGVLLAIAVTGIPGWLSDLSLHAAGSAYAPRVHAGWEEPRSLWRLSSRLRSTEPRPLATVLGHLWDHADPGDALLVTYGDQTLRFYTRLTVYGGRSGHMPRAGESPRWVWLRAQSPGNLPGPGDPATWVRDHLNLERDYRRVELRVPDYPWETRPDPDYFWSRTPSPPVVLYELIDVASDKR